MTTESSFSAATTAWQNSGSFVQIGEHRVFVHRRGIGASILFIHGFPTSCFDWRATMSNLENHFDCIAFDQIGYGLSDKPAGGDIRSSSKPMSSKHCSRSSGLRLYTW